MKKLLLLSILLVSIGISIESKAQVHVTVNLGGQPDWGPTGYDHVDYYYIPDMDAYYDVNSRVYVYYEGGRWVRHSYVPARYRNVDLYRVHKVVINEREPWMHHDRYRNEYHGYAGRYDQQPIRDHHDNGNHYGNRGYNNGNQGYRDDHHDNGNHGDHGHDNGNHGDHGHDNGNHGDHGDHGGDHGNR